MEDVYLAVSRRNNPDQWGLPGGKVDEGETDLEATARETYEEVGIKIDVRFLTPVHTAAVFGKDGKDFLVTTYLYTKADEIEIGAVEQGLIADWKLLAALCVPEFSPFSDYNRAVFDAMSRRRKSFVNEFQCTNPDCTDHPFYVTQSTNRQQHVCAWCNHQVTFVKAILQT